VILEIRTDRTLVPAGTRSTRHLLVTFAAPPARGARERAPLDIALVLDRSGSMGGRKIELARTAVARALQMLRGGDRFALVAYDEQIETVVGTTAASREARRHALARLAGIDARGSTDLAGGYERGAGEIASQRREGRAGACLLLTDGLANVGVTDPVAIAASVARERERGVKTSTFGVGADFDERLLQQMALAGGGHFYYVESPQQIPDLLTSELGEALEVTVRDAALVLRLPEGAEAVPLGATRHDAAGRTLRVALGDLVPDQEVSLVLQLTLPAARDGAELEAAAALVDRDSLLDGAEHVETWGCVAHAESAAQPRDRLVDRAVAEIHAARARAEALELNRDGRHDDASRLLVKVARRIESYAGDDQRLTAMAAGLRRDGKAMGAAMSPAEIKRRHFASANVLSMRDPEGKARRRR
jgi:Ca-activated chloride channel homolog